jgi:hypothetical protein
MIRPAAPASVIELSLHQAVSCHYVKEDGVRYVVFGLWDFESTFAAGLFYSARELRIIADLANQAADWVEGKE